MEQTLCTKVSVNILLVQMMTEGEERESELRDDVS